MQFGGEAWQLKQQWQQKRMNLVGKDLKKWLHGRYSVYCMCEARRQGTITQVLFFLEGTVLQEEESSQS